MARHSGIFLQQVRGRSLSILLVSIIILAIANSNLASASASSSQTGSTTDTIGDTTTTSGNTIAGDLLGFPITASASGALVSIGLNVYTAAENLRVGIYSTYSSRKFSGLLGQSASTASVSGWNDLPVTGVTITSGTTYYLVVQASSGDLFPYSSETTGTQYYRAFSYAAFPSTTSTLSSNSATKNMRMTYGTNALGTTTTSTTGSSTLTTTTTTSGTSTLTTTSTSNSVTSAPFTTTSTSGSTTVTSQTTTTSSRSTLTSTSTSQTVTSAPFTTTSTTGSTTITSTTTSTSGSTTIATTSPAQTTTNNQPCSYQVFTDGTTTYAQNCDTGSIVYSGTVAATIINDAIAALTSGGKIFIKAGIYTFTTAPINLGGGNVAAIGTTSVSGIELYGEGNSTVLSAGTNMNGAVIGTLNVNNWYVHDLQVNGNRVAQSGSGGSAPYLVGIELYNSNNDVIERCYVHDSKTYGIQVYGTADRILNNYVVNNNANGIIVYGGSDYNVEGNTVDGASDVGISVSGQDSTHFINGTIVSDNIVKNINLGVSPFGVNSGVGIYVADNAPAYGTIVSNNNIYNVGYAIWIDSGATDTIVEGNYIHSFTGHPAVELAGAGVLFQANLVNGIASSPTSSALAIDYSPATGVSVIGNQFLNIPGGGNSIVEFSNIAGLKFEGNLIYNSGSEPLHLVGVSKSIISGNVFDTVTSQWGQFMSLSDGTAGSTDNQIIGNQFVTTGSAGIKNEGIYMKGNTFGSSRNIIKDNVFNWLTYPIDIASSTCTDNVIEGNTFTNNTHTASASDSGIRTIFRNNLGYNPVGNIGSPFVSSGDYILDSGGAATPVNATAMTVYQSPKLIMVVTGTYTTAYTLVIQIDGTQVISINNPAANLVFSFQLQPGETFYCQYHTSQTTFVVSGQ